MSAPATIIQAGAFTQDNRGDNNSNTNNSSTLPSIANETAVTTALAPPVMVEVISPSTLRQGYTFDAVYNGQIFPVTVPSGGVKAGQSFRVPFVPIGGSNVEAEAVAVPFEPLPINETTPMLMNPTTPIPPTQQQQLPSNNDHDNTVHTFPTNGAPIGVWSSGLCDFCAEGYCHASLCNAIFFPYILMGQILTRMKLSLFGNPAIGYEYKRATCYWILITLGYIAIRFSLRSCLETGIIDAIKNTLDDDEVTKDLHDVVKKMKHTYGKNCSKDNYKTLRTINIVWIFLTMFVLIKLRRKVRQVYKISQSCPCEDCFYSIFFSCCTVSQLARQTADYQQQRAYCCTDTGLAKGFLESQQQQQQQWHQYGLVIIIYLSLLFLSAGSSALMLALS
mmetsp:Transcript_35995/g.40089  ORF Transcript_35995/g.40089 Transcript_35995/m.40089 type:complete len:392 (+) Transcript_35995:262-1437(+)